MNCQNNVDNDSHSLMDQKKELSLEDWLKEYDNLLDDTSVEKQELYNKIISAQNKVYLIYCQLVCLKIYFKLLSVS